MDFIKKFLLPVLIICGLAMFGLKNYLDDLIATNGIKEGDTVVLQNDASIWNCPGDDGASDSRFERQYSCGSQYEIGYGKTGLAATVVANEFGQISRSGYIRIQVDGLYSKNPLTLEEFTMNGTYVGWIDINNIK
jgi:hypothetical protein